MPESCTANRTMSTREAAEYVGLRPQTLINGRCDGTLDIPYVKVSARRVVYRQRDLDEWMALRTVRPGNSTGSE